MKAEEKPISRGTAANEGQLIGRSDEPIESKSLKRLRQRKVGGRIARVVFFMLVLSALVLYFVPWQQTIVGSGEVSVFSPNDRPQTVEAQIPGRISKWFVQEGQVVSAGEVIAEIEDIDSKFLDPNLVKTIERQNDALKGSLTAEQSRLTKIQTQITQVEGSRNQQLRNAKERVRQSKNRVNAAKASLDQAKKNLTAFTKVAKASAEQRKLQAQDIVRQNEQTLIAAKQQRDIERINYERIKYLFTEGLESKRSFELAETAKVSSETRVDAIEETIKAAKRVVQLGVLGQDQALIDIERQRDVVTQAEETVRATERDVSIAENDVTRIDNDTNGLISSLQGNEQSVRSSIEKANSDIEKNNVELANVTVRRKQQKILAPASGDRKSVV